MIAANQPAPVDAPIARLSQIVRFWRLAIEQER
jgi:hypothetical protein